MNKAEARRLVAGVVATTIAHDRDDIGAGWIYETDTGEDRPKADVDRIHAACYALPG